MLRDWSDRVPDPPPESRLALGGCAVMLVVTIAIMIWSSVAPLAG